MKQTAHTRAQAAVDLLMQKRIGKRTSHDSENIADTKALLIKINW